MRQRLFGVEFTTMRLVVCLLLNLLVAAPISAQTCEMVAKARAAEGRQWRGEGPLFSYNVGNGIEVPYSVGNGVTAPVLKRFVSPTYPQEALKAHYGGSVVFNVVVGKDGRPLKVLVSRALQFDGLDLAATEAVQQWQFAPGELRGGAVPVHIVVEVLFNRERGTTGACVQ